MYSSTIFSVLHARHCSFSVLPAFSLAVRSEFTTADFSWATPMTSRLHGRDVLRSESSCVSAKVSYTITGFWISALTRTSLLSPRLKTWTLWRIRKAERLEFGWRRLKWWTLVMKNPHCVFFFFLFFWKELEVKFHHHSILSFSSALGHTENLTRHVGLVHCKVIEMISACK